MKSIENNTLIEMHDSQSYVFTAKEKLASNRILNKKLTSKRRKSMLVKVIEFNITNNHLSHDKKLYLKQLLTEAKYYHNYLLNLSQKTCVDNYGDLIYTNSIFNIDTKNNSIEVFNSSTKELMPYEIQHLSSQMKQKIKDKISDNIKSLYKRKAKGFKVGKLKFKSFINLPLKQFNNTYYLDDDFKYLSIQGTKHNFKLNPNKAIKKLSKQLGFSQLSIESLVDNKIIEIANSEIIKVNNSYKFSLTIYINPEIYQNDKILIIQNKIKNYLKDKSNLLNNSLTKQPRINKNRVRKADNVKKTEFLTTNNLQIKDTKQSNNTHQNNKQINKITAFNFNLTKEQRGKLSLTCVGLDAGIGNEFTLNCGELYQRFNIDSRNNEFLLGTLAKIKVAQKELSQFNHRSKRLNKNLNYKLNKESNKIIYSRKYKLLKNKLANLWVKYENIKTNMINHLLGFLKQFKEVNFQNEMIKSWHQNKLKGYSKKVQSGILGKVYAKLKLASIKDPSRYRMLETHHKTTQDCVMCSKSNKLKLSDRVYKCICGYENNRDTHGAFNMILKNNIIENNINKKSFKNKVFGRNTSNLVQIITAETSKDNTINVFDIARFKLESKSYMKLALI